MSHLGVSHAGRWWGRERLVYWGLAGRLSFHVVSGLFHMVSLDGLVCPSSQHGGLRIVRLLTWQPSVP